MQSAALDGDYAVIDQDVVGRGEWAVVLGVDGEVVGADPDVGVAAGHVVPGVGGDFFGLGRVGAVAIGDGDRVGGDVGLDAAEEEVVGFAAGGEGEQGDRDGETLAHDGSVNHFAYQSQ